MATPALDASVEFAVGPKVRHAAKRLSHRAQRRLFLAALVAVDVMMLMLAFGLAYFVRFHAPLQVFGEGLRQPLFYAGLSLVLIPVWLAVLWVYRLYDWDVLLGGLEEYALLFQACVVGAIFIAMLQFFNEQLLVARGWVGLTWALTFALLAAGRFALRHAAYAARRRGYMQAPALLIGANEEGRLLGEQLLAWPTSGINLLGYLDDELEPGARVCGNPARAGSPGSPERDGLMTLGAVDRLDEMVQRYQIEELILATSALTREQVLDIFRAYGTSRAVHIRMSSGLFELLSTGLAVKELAYVPLIGVNRVRLAGPERVVKAVMDYSLTLAGLIALAPFLLLIALLVKLTSPGPVFYRRRVMGLNGRRFDALKFRTMRADGDAILAANPQLLDELATTHKIKGDPRITSIGLFLRKYSLDELPQLFNVLRGEMSLVGPRMISPPELEAYGQWAMNLLTVRPGLTGLWQVSGRSDVPYEERVRLDMFYIRNYSLWLDLQLIVRTIPVVLSGKGAY